MATGRKLGIGFLGSIWSGLVGLLAIPFYVKFLGIESYGLVGFYLSLQAVMQILDFGLSPAANREIARHTALEDRAGAREVLGILGVLNFGTAMLIVAVTALGATPLAYHWLRPVAGTERELVQSVQLMGLAIACRWPVGMYQSAVLGSGGFATASVVSAIGATASALLTVAALAWSSGDARAFFVSQGVVALALALVLRSIAWRRIGGRRKLTMNWAKLRTFWGFSAGMGGISVATLVLTQADKIILSRLLPLGDFGRYTLASTVASSIYLLLTPAFNFFYPRMSGLVAKGESAPLLTFYTQGTRLLSIALFPLVLSMAAHARPLLTVWTGDAQLAESVAPLAALLLLGTACNGVMHFPYALQLAFGDVRLPLSISISLAAVSIPLLALLTWRYGVVGSASTWLFTNLAYVFVGTWLTHRKLLTGQGFSWLVEDVGAPFLTTLLVVIPGWLVASSIASAPVRACFAIAVGCLSLFANLFLLPRVSRINLWRHIRA